MHRARHRRSVGEPRRADELAQDRRRRNAVRIDRYEGREQPAETRSRGELRRASRHLEEVALGEDLEDADLVDQRRVEHALRSRPPGIDVEPFAAPYARPAREVLLRGRAAGVAITDDPPEESDVRRLEDRERIERQRGRRMDEDAVDRGLELGRVEDRIESVHALDDEDRRWAEA